LRWKGVECGGRVFVFFLVIDIFFLVVEIEVFFVVVVVVVIVVDDQIEVHD